MEKNKSSNIDLSIILLKIFFYLNKLVNSFQ